ncbi:hypothetical protein [Phocaeicola salanitronis]|uniref:hypothetical protein n=1 Tax=Phocaeicola salanitronis TaxID=376805 RepID=UPI0023F77669|nr:hypothetical protein [Phocaeicola salanitronis]
MIFVATNADASANNLGKISIKNISHETIDLLSLYGKEWTDDQKIAIDDFIVAFNGASWKSKVSTLCVPILVKPTDPGVYLHNNDGLKESLIFYDLISKKILESNNPIINPTYGAGVKITNNGVMLSHDNSESAEIHNNAGIIFTANARKLKSQHFGVYMFYTTYFGTGIAGTNALRIASNVSYILYQRITTTEMVPASNTKGLFVFNYDGYLSQGNSYMIDKLIPNNFINTAAIEDIDTTQGVYFSFKENADVACAGLFTAGDYLTDEELTEYAGLINNLISVLSVSSLLG